MPLFIFFPAGMQRVANARRHRPIRVDAGALDGWLWA